MLVHNFLPNKSRIIQRSTPFSIEVSRSTHRTSSDTFLFVIENKLVLGGGNAPIPTEDIEWGEGEGEGEGYRGEEVISCVSRSEKRRASQTVFLKILINIL